MPLYIPHYRPGTGRLRSITGTNPAAGVEIVEVIPAGVVRRFLSLRVILTTNATVANREVQLILDDGTFIFCETSSGFNQVASTTIGYTFSSFGQNSNPTQSTERAIALPTITFLPGWRLRTAVINLNAADDWAAPRMLFEEWIVG